MTLLRSLLLVLCALLGSTLSAQTAVLAEPVADARGLIAFRILQVVRVEGRWYQAPKVGDLVRPENPQKAYPLGRFGEAVLICFYEPDRTTRWQGFYVHNGIIPSLNCASLAEVVLELENRPLQGSQGTSKRLSQATSDRSRTQHSGKSS